MSTDAGATDSSFAPPAEFREQASWADPKVYEEAAADPVAWWTARSKELLDWDVEPTTGLNDSDPPFYRWFEDSRINASAQCLDRHVEVGNSRNSSAAWGDCHRLSPLRESEWRMGHRPTGLAA